MLTRVTGLIRKIHHQVSQSNWLDGRGFDKRLSKTSNKRLAKDCPIYR